MHRRIVEPSTWSFANACVGKASGTNWISAVITKSDAGFATDCWRDTFQGKVIAKQHAGRA
jgi:hypothetical protein